MMGSQYFQCLTTSNSGWSFNHGDKVLWASKFFFFFFFKKALTWTMRTVHGSQIGRFNCSSNSFMLFVHRTVLVLKKTVLVRASRLSGSNRTVWSGSENLDCWLERIHLLLLIWLPSRGVQNIRLTRHPVQPTTDPPALCGSLS